MTVATRPNELEDVRACLRHYEYEIREYIEDNGRAPVELHRYTCGADYQHEASIDPALFRSGIERINSVTGLLFFPEDIREAIDLVIRNL